MRIANILCVVAALACVVAPCDQAQALGPAAAPFTLWNFLGIPQGFNKLRDATSNRTGNRPNAERKPPVKALADPANLTSPNPAIAAAAKIKTEEDLAPQKIKALKYLSQIGCGCYPDVKEALLGALDDCTEEVRYQAVLAIEDAASQHCSVCNKNCCCDQEMTLKLSQIAYERNDQGCWLEASERVREAAKRAMCACCPGQGPISPETVIEEQPAAEEGIPEGAPSPPAPLPPNADSGASRGTPRSSVAGTRAHTTSTARVLRQDPAVADDDANLDIVTVDFGNQGGRAPAPVTATRRSAVPPSNGVKAPAARPLSNSGAQTGPSSRRSAAERGLGVPITASRKSYTTPAATRNQTPAAKRSTAAKQPSQETNGWGWPVISSKVFGLDKEPSTPMWDPTTGNVKASYSGN